jgi:DNA mismatch endonuclease (patch repair protein)
MADVFSKAKRSFVMSRIRSRGNKDTEVALAKLFRQNKITGWRRQVQIGGRAALPRRRDEATEHRRPTKFLVRPDFIFPKFKLAVFVDGCFWHGCPRHATQPKSNRAFWKNKFARNIARDKQVNRTLRSANWRVLRIWECALRRAGIKTVLRRIRREL